MLSPVVTFEVLKSIVRKDYLLTTEMYNHFVTRTNKHIDRYDRYYALLVGSHRDQSIHDESKFEFPEFPMYVAISWGYECKKRGVTFDVSSDLELKMHFASEHHVLTNDHHPEYWAPMPADGSPMINLKDRDATTRESPLDCSRMPKEAIAKMVADWCAMTEELGQDSPHLWANKVLGSRFHFTPKQENLIRLYIDVAWGSAGV